MTVSEFNTELFKELKERYYNSYATANNKTFECDLVYIKGYVRAQKVISNQPFIEFKVRIGQFKDMVETLESRNK
jgi:hypothetical protein